jgi:hypothetical protein
MSKTTRQRTLDELVNCINEATSPYTFRTDEEHERMAAIAREARKELHIRFSRHDWRESDNGLYYVVRERKCTRWTNAQGFCVDGNCPVHGACNL